MPVPTLKALATGICIDNIKLVRDIGIMPYGMVEGILRHVEDADQLLELQTNSPHLAYHTKDLWLALIRRDFPKYDEDPIEPTNPLSWCKVYRKLKSEDQAEQQKHLETLKAEMLEATKAKLNNRATFLPGVITPHQLEIKGRRGGGAASNIPGQILCRPTKLTGYSRDQMKPGPVAAKSAAMKKIVQQASSARGIAGPKFPGQGRILAPQPSNGIRKPAATRRNHDGIKFRYVKDKETGMQEDLSMQGSRLLTEYLRDHMDEVNKRNEKETELALSPLRSISTTPKSSPSKISSPIRRPQLSASPASTSKSSPLPAAQLTTASIPKLDIAKEVLEAGAPTASKPLPVRKMSLQEYGRKRKAAQMSP